jgi:hypothetical protein
MKALIWGIALFASGVGALLLAPALTTIIRPVMSVESFVFTAIGMFLVVSGTLISSFALLSISATNHD